MSDMTEIEKLTRDYADCREQLADRVHELQREIEDLKRRYLHSIKRAVARTAEAHDRLAGAIQDAPDLFEKPRTVVLCGVRVGYQKDKGKVVVDDQEATVRRIREQLPEDQAELLIRVRESVDLRAAGELTAADMRRLGIRLEETGDKVVIRPTDTEVDKLVNALLREAERIEEAA